jgi:uncharacterized protein YdeI (BOF family)
MNAKEMIMKPSTIAKALAITLAALALGTAPNAKANEGCSNATLKGTFADKDTGFITSPPAVAGPFAGVNVETFDGNGALTGHGMVSLNGEIAQQSYTGTYTVNSDCTGTYTVEISPFGLTTHAFFVIAGDGNELQVVITDPGNVVTCIARRQFRVDDWRP